MNSKYILLCIVTAIVIVGIYQIVAVGRVNYPEYNLKEGQVADVEIIAPFDYPILKSTSELADEREQVLSQVNKPYEISDDPMFEAIKALDNIYAVLCSLQPTLDPNAIATELKRNGYIFSSEGLSFATHPMLRDKIYESLRNKLRAIYGNNLNNILALNEKYTLVPYGNHSRGSKFIDLSNLIDEQLTSTINLICQSIPDFYYGRLDIKFKNWEDLKNGENFSIIEVNGAGSEPTHIYDPTHSIFYAWKEIKLHCKILYEISLANKKLRGLEFMTTKEGMKMLRENKKQVASLT